MAPHAGTRTLVDPAQLHRVLLVELNRMGDVVHALSAARWMRNWLPDAELVMLVDARYGCLAELETSVDRVITSEKSDSVRGFARTVRQVRQERFDLVCSLSPIRRNAVVTVLGRRKFAVGYLAIGRRTPNFLRKTHVRSLGFQLPHRERYGFDHIAEAPRRVCRALGIDTKDSPGPLLSVGSSSRGSSGDPYIVMHPFAGWRFREWPQESVRGLVKEILDTTGSSVVLVGSDGDRGRMDSLMNSLSHEGRVRSYAGLPLDKLAAVLEQATLFIGTDSGPYQLSVWLGTPSIGLFGPAPPEITGSRRASDRTIYYRLECSPCNQHRCVRSEDPCMHRITVTDVAVQVRQMLASPR